MRKIVTIGRGGTGKTSFVALVTKYLIETGQKPLLLVDADPDQSLAEMIGVDPGVQGKKTISELLVDTFIEGGGTTVGVPPSQRMESEIWGKGLYEGEYFDLISIGIKWVEGCYCLPNAALKGALESLIKTYKYVLIDSPAGLEHLNRRITSEVDDIIDVIDPSVKSFEHIERAHRITKEVEIGYKNFYAVAGFRFPESLEAEAKEKLKDEYLGKVAYDAEVEKYVIRGRSLLELPSKSPGYVSVKKILEKMQ